MSRPLIGITPLYDYNLTSWWMIPGYPEGIMKAGGTPVIMPFSDNAEMVEELVSSLDGFIITGGPDVNPALYGEDARLQLGLLAPKRDVNEKLIYEMIRKHNKPVLGICRGHQLINVLEGGTLFQDIPSQNPTETLHSQRQPNYIMTHTVDVVEGTPLSNWLDGAKEFDVNSFHHQAVKDLAPCLKPMALSKGDLLVESFYHPERRFTVGVQWHPELAYKDNPLHEKIFEALVQASK